MDYIIFSDSASDIDTLSAKTGDIQFFTMSYSVGDEMRICTKNESKEDIKEFYDGQRKGDLTKTIP